MKVNLIGYTEFIKPDGCDGWYPTHDEHDSAGEELIEFAGRECYQSWEKPNPETRTTYDYVTKSILAHKHFSVLEHVNATYRITEIPRSLTHEFVRHRHFSYSELSQRYVDMTTVGQIDHPILRDLDGDDAETARQWLRIHAQDTGLLYYKLADMLNNIGYTRKEARQAARQVLPESTETRIVVTGNLRAWRHFLDLRATPQADTAIRELAIELWRSLQHNFPASFSDYRLMMSSKGFPFLQAEYAEES